MVQTNGLAILEKNLNNRFLRERDMVSTPNMEYQVTLCIFQKNSPMATLGLKKMGRLGKRSALLAVSV